MTSSLIANYIYKGGFNGTVASNNYSITVKSSNYAL